MAGSSCKDFKVHNHPLPFTSVPAESMTFLYTKIHHCIHNYLFLNLDKSRLWYAAQQLSSDVCTYLRSLDKTFLTMVYFGLDDDIVRFTLGDQFRSICMSRIHSM